MARPLRIEYEGAHYHVTTRGNERKAIFRDDIDRRKFLELLGRAVEQFDIRVHAYVLIDNHYHLMIETYSGSGRIGEQVGLHLSAVGNAVQQVGDKPTLAIAQALRELEQSFKNQES